MSASGDKLGVEAMDPKEKRKSLRLTSEKRENSTGKDKEKKEKEKHKDKKEKDKKEKDKDKDKKADKDKSKDKDKKTATSSRPSIISTSVSSVALTGKERKGILREGSSGSLSGSDGKKEKSSSSRTLKLGRKRSTKTEPMPEPSKLLEMWNQLLVRARIAHRISARPLVLEHFGQTKAPTPQIW
jgi:phage protein D